MVQMTFINVIEKTCFYDLYYLLLIVSLKSFKLNLEPNVMAREPREDTFF